MMFLFPFFWGHCINNPNATHTKKQKQKWNERENRIPPND